MKDHSQSAPAGSTGFPTLDFPEAWQFTNSAGQPRTFLVSFVHTPGERDEQGHGQLCNGYLFPEPDDAEWLTSPLAGQFEFPLPLYLRNIPAGSTAGEPGMLHRLNPSVKV